MSYITLFVLQGLVLGPAHFPLYINANGMQRSSNKIWFVHFADHTTVFASDSNINNFHAILNRKMVGVNNW